MNRRCFLQGSIALTGVSLLTGRGEAHIPWQPLPMRRIGYLGLGTSASSPFPAGPQSTALVEGLRELGWVQGQNIAFEHRYAQRPEELPALAAELAGLPVELIFAGSAAAALAAKLATATIPIVMGASGDAVEDGLVASLNRPGGNVTGLTVNAADLNAKHLQLLRETVPGAARVGELWTRTGPDSETRLAELESAARSLGLQLVPRAAGAPEDLEPALAAMSAGLAEALHVSTSPLFTNNAGRIAELAARYRLPSIMGTRQFPDAGGLMSYNPSLAEQFRYAATYVDKILKGAKPAGLPVEQPTKVDFVVNLKTAKALGLTFHSSVLQQATEIIG